MTGDRGYAVLVAAFTALIDLAVVVAVFGMVSALTGQDVLTGNVGLGRHVPFLLLPTVIGVTVLVIFGLLSAAGVVMVKGRPRISVLSCVGIGLAAYILYVGLGAVMVAGSGTGATWSTAAVGLALTPFAIANAVIAFGIALGYELVIAARYRDRRPPEWPWERDEDE